MLKEDECSNKSEQGLGDVVIAKCDGTTINAEENFNLEKIIGFDALYDSMMKCKKGVMWKDSTVSYVLNGIESTLKLEEELKTGKYKARPPKTFTIFAPKRRDIISIVFRDRVYQRSQNDNVIYPTMVRSFIYDNMACQTNKGTDRARDRVKCFLQRQWRKHKKEFYALQIDIHGYYPNMRHDIAECRFAEKLPPSVMKMITTTFEEQYGGDVGFNPGSQLIQIAGISMLDKVDHFIKEDLAIKCYLRYMDDLLLLHEDREYLEYCKMCIGESLMSIGFEYNPKKTQIYKVTKGINFLGFTFKLTDSGKVLMFLDSKNVKRERKKLFRLVGLVNQGERTKAKVYECYSGWYNHASKGSSTQLLNRMNQYLKSLWGDNNANQRIKARHRRSKRTRVFTCSSRRLKSTQ